MMRSWGEWLILVTLISMSLACARPQATDPLVTKAGLTHVESGAQSGVVGRGFRVIRDDTEFVEVYRLIHEHDPDPPPLPVLDLHTEVALVAFMGKRGTTGYHISLGRVATIAGATAKVTIMETRPPRDAIVSQVTTTPYAIATLRRDTIESVDFVDQGGTRLATYRFP